MDLLTSFRIALRALQANKLRSILTMLGIIIGVGAVIAMIAVGSGAKERIAEQVQSLGSDVLMVLPGSTISGAIRLGFGTLPTLTEDDAKAIISEVPVVKLVAPLMRGTASVVYGSQNWSTVIQGTTPEYLEIREWPLQAGQPFTKRDVNGATTVALLGQTVVDNLFGVVNPVGQIIRIKNVPFTVIGVLAPKGQSALGGDQDDRIFIPISTAKTKVLGVSQANTRSVPLILMKTWAPELIPVAIAQTRDLLRQRHRILPDQNDDFTIQNLSEIFAVGAAVAKTLAILLGAIASVSLLVGGIGIMNIMLVSVTERTKEIGIRRAVGAKSQDILSQFLVEAVTLSSIGGMIGIALGVGGAKLIAFYAKWPILVSPGAILLAFLFSAGVGIFFGYYPAHKAAHLDPIEALRYE